MDATYAVMIAAAIAVAAGIAVVASLLLMGVGVEVPASYDCGADFDTDEQNCGSCGIVCGDNMECLSGSCECVDGFGECDANVLNGCETALGTDENCGSCGDVCPSGEVCTDGECGEPVEGGGGMAPPPPPPPPAF